MDPAIPAAARLTPAAAAMTAPLGSFTITIEAGPLLVATAVRLCAALERLCPTPIVPALRPAAEAVEPEPEATPELREQSAPDARPEIVIAPEPEPEQPSPAALTPAEMQIAATPGHRRGKIWTPDRIALLERDYPSGRPVRELWRALLALPGLPITHHDHLAIKAHGLGLSRTKRPAAAAPDMPAEQPDAPDTMRPDTQSVTYATAFAWAGERGLATQLDGMDIGRVNRKRIELGLPQFQIASRPALHHG